MLTKALMTARDKVQAFALHARAEALAEELLQATAHATDRDVRRNLQRAYQYAQGTVEYLDKAHAP